LAASLFSTVPAQASDTVYYYSSDSLHSEVVITDQNRNVVERTHYAPYGQVLDRSLRDGPGYTGHAEDPGTGLVYMQQRYYDPVAGRFLSADPVGLSGSGANFNRYWYANDNPYRYTDPDGRLSDCTGSHIGGAACGGLNLHVTYFVTPPSQQYSPSTSNSASSHAQAPQIRPRTESQNSGSAKQPDKFHVDSLFSGDTKPTFTGMAAYGLGMVAHKTPGSGNDELAMTPAGLGLEATATWHLADFKFNFSNTKTSPVFMSVLSGRAGLGLVGGIEIRYTPPGAFDIDITGGFGAAADAHIFDIGTKLDQSGGN
jgi:RHS repeat-associated protein